jgi:ATP-dependent DNA helicase PIF1
MRTRRPVNDAALLHTNGLRKAMESTDDTSEMKFTDEDYSAFGNGPVPAAAPTTPLSVRSSVDFVKGVAGSFVAAAEGGVENESLESPPTVATKRSFATMASHAIPSAVKKTRQISPDGASTQAELRNMLASFGEVDGPSRRTSAAPDSKLKSILANFGGDDKPVSARASDPPQPAPASTEDQHQRLWDPALLSGMTPTVGKQAKQTTEHDASGTNEMDEFLAMMEPMERKPTHVTAAATVINSGASAPVATELSGAAAASTDAQDRFDYLLQLADGADPEGGYDGAAAVPIMKPETIKYIEDSDLTDEQLELIDMVNQGLSVFGTGMAGTGKSLVVEALSQRLDRANVVYAVTATTGKAGSLIGGTTLDSWMGLGRCEDPIVAMVRTVMRKPVLRDRWMSTKVLVIDEVSMMQSRKLAILHRIGQHVRNRFDLFCGGLQLILFGDFGQLESVKTEKDLERGRNYATRFKDVMERSDSDYQFLFRHPLWVEHIRHHVQFTKVFRQEDPAFVEMLGRMRKGCMTADDHNMMAKRAADSKAFPTVESMADANGIAPLQIFPYNKEVNATNAAALKRLEPDASKHFIFHAATAEINPSPDNHQYFADFFRDQRTSPGCAEVITLTVGLKMMLTKNICVSQHLTNGSQCIVESMVEVTPELLDELRRGEKGEACALDCVNFTHLPVMLFETGRRLTVIPETWTLKHKASGGIAYYHQLPLQPASAITTWKVQGTTLDSACASLASMTEPNHVYVITSRVRSLDKLFIQSYTRASVRTHRAVREYYAELDEKDKAKQLSRDALRRSQHVSAAAAAF